MDDTNLAYLCDPAIRARTAARGDDPDLLTRLYVRLVNDAIRARPAGMAAAIHLCRGNFKSAWVSEGGYEPVAEILFGQMNVDAFFLEYDDERSGDFAPLRFMPRDKQVVLGLMSSKQPEVEAADLIKRRLDEAGAYVSLDQSPSATSAASRPPLTATSSTKTTSGASWREPWRSRATSGDISPRDGAPTTSEQHHPIVTAAGRRVARGAHPGQPRAPGRRARVGLGRGGPGDLLLV
jgi:hypothetical protein